MNPRQSPSPRRTKGRKLTNAEGHAAIDAARRALTAPKETPRTPKKPAPFARLMYGTPPVGADSLKLHKISVLKGERPYFVIDARPQSLEAMKESAAKFAAFIFYCGAHGSAGRPAHNFARTHWRQYRKDAAALMQSWGLTRGTV